MWSLSGLGTYKWITGTVTRPHLKKPLARTCLGSKFQVGWGSFDIMILTTVDAFNLPCPCGYFFTLEGSWMPMNLASPSLKIHRSPEKWCLEDEISLLKWFLLGGHVNIWVGICFINLSSGNPFRFFGFHIFFENSAWQPTLFSQKIKETSPQNHHGTLQIGEFASLGSRKLSALSLPNPCMLRS